MPSSVFLNVGIVHIWHPFFNMYRSSQQLKQGRNDSIEQLSIQSPFTYLPTGDFILSHLMLSSLLCLPVVLSLHVLLLVFFLLNFVSFWIAIFLVVVKPGTEQNRME